MSYLHSLSKLLLTNYFPYFSHDSRKNKIDFDPILHRGLLPHFQRDLRYLQERLESHNSQIKNQEAIKYRKRQNFCNKIMFVFEL